MSRMRSFSFPRITTARSSEESISSIMWPYPPFAPAHSRDSSNGSSNSSPITPTFSVRGGHNRVPSSPSSLVTIPDSPSNPPKSMLHDLVEDPSERDDLEEFDDAPQEPLCICDSPYCEHRGRESSFDELSQWAMPEWTAGDDYFDDDQLPSEPVAKRRRNEEQSSDGLASRLSRQFSKRFGHRSSASAPTLNMRSAPNSRPTSLRLPTTRSFTTPNAHELRNINAPLLTATQSTPQTRSVSPPGTRSRASSQVIPKPMEMSIPETVEDPIDRQELASTPLLPLPTMAEYFDHSQDAMISPLQSPTVASASAIPSIANTPVSTPVLPGGFPTPPLSTKQSVTSLNIRSSSVLQPVAEIPPLAIAEETDEWAIKLGHANFQITPEPYLPGVCDAQACRQLRDDWEAARLEYMRQAARVSEHYGITSQTYKLTEQKWAEIDAAWRRNHEMANAEAQALGESTLLQPLAETQALKKMPSLQDPQQPSKFPAVEEADIVGPMVQYAKIKQRRQTPSKKPAFLRIFTDPASLLAGRASLAYR